MTPAGQPLEAVPVLGIGVARGRSGGEIKREKVVAAVRRRGRLVRGSLESRIVQGALRSRWGEVE